MKTRDIIGLVIYILAAITFAVTGNWFTALAWAACAIVQGTVMLVRSDLQHTIDTLLGDVKFYKEQYEGAMKEWRKAVNLNGDILKNSDDIIKLDRGIQEDNKFLSDMVIGLLDVDEMGQPLLKREAAIELLRLRQAEKDKAAQEEEKKSEGE